VRTDNAGNIESAQSKTDISFFVDNDAPTVNISSPSNGATISGTTYLVTGTASDAAAVSKVEVSTNGTTWSLATDTSGNGSWSTWSASISPPASGTLNISARATDLAGDTSTTTVSALVNTGFTITVTPGSNGSITPGTIDVVQGTSQTFAIAPDSGYAIGTVTVDGTPIGTVTSYTFQNMQTAHTIAATFIPTITASAGPGGTVSPSGTTRVASGTDQTYTVRASAGYNVTDVLVDGSSVGAVSTYTFSAVTVPHTISASFAAD
jgi:Bacterial Ig domain